MARLGIPEDQPIEHKWISKSIENAQKKVEGHNFSIRKNVLEYDDVMNQQRKTVYALRRDILAGGKDSREVVLSMIEEIVNFLVNNFAPQKVSPEKWQLDEIKKFIARLSNSDIEDFDLLQIDDFIGMKILSEARGKLAQQLYDTIVDLYLEKMNPYGEELSTEMEKHISLEVLDQFWRRHLLAMDHLREGIGLRGYGQKDPKLEYKREGFRLFTEMMNNIYAETVRNLFAVQVVDEESIERMEAKEQRKEAQVQQSTTNKDVEKVPIKRTEKKVGRNDPCPCGSGKKFKKCCMGKGIYD
jgi:preprotein translocase subunit SecA